MQHSRAVVKPLRTTSSPRFSSQTTLASKVAAWPVTSKRVGTAAPSAGVAIETVDEDRVSAGALHRCGRVDAEHLGRRCAVDGERDRSLPGAAAAAVQTSDCTASWASSSFMPGGLESGSDRSIVTWPPSAAAVAVTPSPLRGFS